MIEIKIGENTFKVPKASVSWAIIFAVIFTIIPFAGEYARDRLTSTSFWFVYESVESVYPRYEIGEDVSMISFVTKQKPIDTSWTARIYCWKDEGWTEYEIKTWDVVPNYDKQLYRQPWELKATDGLLPYYVTECFDYASIVGTTKHGFRKAQNICSNVFGIGKDPEQELPEWCNI